MARAEKWINEDGLEVDFGPVVRDNGRAGTQHTYGKIKQIQVEVEAGNLISEGDRQSSKAYFIPAGASVLSARLVLVTESFDEAIEVGTAERDGTAIDADGLIATGTPTAGAVVTGAGALIGTNVAEDSYIIVTATTDEPTAGRATLVVEYVI